MQTNPNIILSANRMAQPRLPDVNAMMQTRTAGLEGIYNIEQARAEQQRAAQKEQEAAAVEAMLPSVMAAYSDASDVGLDRATSLMPTEVRDTFAPFITRLKGIPDMATRKAILEAELAKDEAGRAVLSRILTPYQEGTLGIQRGQLDLSRQRLAQDAAKMAAEAAGAGQPKVAQWITDDAGNATGLDAQGNIVASQPGIGKKTAPAGGGATEAKLRQSAKEADIAITELSKAAAPGGLIDMSTGSIVGNWLDTIVAQGSGGLMVLPGDVAAAQMEVVAHLARMAVPRFEGPQSEYDAKLYERAAGQLSDPNISTITKRAAAQTLIDMLKTRRDQFAFSGSDDRGVLPADSGALQYDADGNLIE